eukprot:g4478.t1
MVVFALTVWVIFIDDIRIIALPKEVDVGILIMNWVIFAIFWIEVVGFAILVPHYFMSWQFWLDVLAALSLIPFDALNSAEDRNFSRLARASRVLRVIRPARAASMAMKLEHNVFEGAVLSPQKEERREAAEHGRRASFGEDVSQFVRHHMDHAQIAPKRTYTMIVGQEQEQQTKRHKMGSLLGQSLMQQTNVKMLVGVIAVLVGTAIFQTQHFDRSAVTGLHLLDSSNGTISSLAYVNGIERNEEEPSIYNPRPRVVKLTVKGAVRIDQSAGTEFQSLRSHDLYTITVGNSSCVLNMRDYYVSQSVFTIFLSLFIVVIMLCWECSFRRAYMSTVIDPLRQIIELLRKLAANPRLAADFGVANSMMEKLENDSYSRHGRRDITDELQVIERSIAKFGRLLHVSFGEAGVTIIARNLQRGRFDPVAPGVRVQAVFGFCDIRNFTSLCEILRRETMIFTNRIAALVHRYAHASGGDVNKNIGDAFFVVWKLHEIPASAPTPVHLGHTPERVSKHRSSERRDSKYVHHLSKEAAVVDAALTAFSAIDQELEKSANVQMYAKRTTLQERMPGFRIRMGYGLHLGWAIEGAIGSKYKIDASYLSPHVNLCSRLEAATKQFGVNLLLSADFYAELTFDMKEMCRAVDRVTVKGSDQPITLYTYDIDGGRSSSFAVPGCEIELEEAKGEKDEEKDVKNDVKEEVLNQGYERRQAELMEKMLRDQEIPLKNDVFEEDKTYRVNTYVGNYVCSPVEKDEGETLNGGGGEEDMEDEENVEENDVMGMSQSIEESLGFLAGVCLEHGSGWWRYRWCHRREVVQFHVGKDESENVEWSLGKFDAQKKTSLSDQAEDSPVVARHYFLEGQHCDETGKGRSTEVRFVCCDPQKSARSDFQAEPLVQFLGADALINPGQDQQRGRQQRQPHPRVFLSSLKGSCFQKQEGWWTYEFCMGKHLKQMHYHSRIKKGLTKS